MPRDLFLTLLILGVLACTPVFFHFWRKYGPRDPYWRALSDVFGTEEEPQGRLYENQMLRFPPPIYSKLWYHGARFDFRIGDKGLWLEYLGPDELKCVRRMFIPWTRIIFRKHRQTESDFVFIVHEEIDVAIGREVSQVMADRTSRRYN